MSLRARLLVAVAAVALLALVAADFATYTALRTFLYNHIDSSLESAHRPVEAELGGAGTGNGGGAPPGTTQAPAPSREQSAAPPTGTAFCQEAAMSLGPETFVEVRAASGAVVSSDRCSASVQLGGKTYAPALPKTITGLVPMGPQHEPATYFTTGSTTSGGPAFRVRVSELTSGDLLVLAQPLNSTQSTLSQLVDIELAVTGGALLVAVVIGWWLVRLGLAPLRRVEVTAEAITGGDLAHRVPGESARTEVGRVARALNVMLERIEQAFAERDETEAQLRASEERMRRFVADASHELRTPVTAVSAYAQLLERADQLSDEDRRRIMSGIAGETERMGQLVQDLLLLARLDEGRPPAREPLELVDLAAGAVETARMLGRGWPVRLEASEAVEVLGDPVALRQVIDNFLANVRSHTPEGTTATVRVRREGADAVIEVADDGPGLSADQAARVFERFYRADPSRARSHGGAGLGLAIAASIVEAHGGTVRASPAPGGGAVFTVRLPAYAGQSDERGGDEGDRAGEEPDADGAVGVATGPGPGSKG
ncbi:MAG TPA: HAMP domain-containing sensor histidine kinase [Acidimicrobiales bacterium]|nr:HAMP domain-containing sensor histidine kinase [Acidimicrobiales bacterium]